MKKWLRFSLLTLILLHLELAGLVWLNVTEREWPGRGLEGALFYEENIEKSTQQGWPKGFYFQQSGTVTNYTSAGFVRDTQPFQRSFVIWRLVWPDVGIWLALLGGTAVVCEYLVRRRKRDGGER